MTSEMPESKEGDDLNVEQGSLFSVRGESISKN